mgnify:CR=1 FL=1
MNKKLIVASDADPEVLDKELATFEITQYFDEIVISASKFEQSKRDIPQKVISIDAEKVQFANPQPAQTF